MPIHLDNAPESGYIRCMVAMDAASEEGREMTKREALVAVVEMIEREAGYCETAARRHGWDGAAYQLTAEDCEAITDAVVSAHGRKPNTEEWRQAGYPSVGSAHVDR
jgi:hypothetical protein